jgi:2-phosphoglycolate phosphatase
MSKAAGAGGIRAVLFDLDGTLADTAPDLCGALNRLRVERGLEPVPPELTRPYTSSGARGLIGAGLGISPDHPEYEALRLRFLDLYAENIHVDTRLFPGMTDLLSALEQRELPWGIVTNKASRFTGPLMNSMGLAARAACIVSGDTTPHAKPRPEPLLHAAKELQLPPAACLYLGDDLRDVQAARAAGMPVIAAAFGYLGDSDPGTWCADAIIHHPLEVLNFLETHPSMG